MTSGSVGLDMIAIPGGTPAATISGIIAVEMKQPDTMTEPFEKTPSPLRIMSMFPHPLKAFLKRRADEHAGGGGGEGAGAGQEMQ